MDIPMWTATPTDAALSIQALLSPSDIELPRCQSGVGTVIPTRDSPQLLDGVRVDPLTVWPDDRGHFLEVLRVGYGLSADFPPESTQVSATATYPGVVKAFHYHLRQYDCWSVVTGMLQVALVDLRRGSPTFGLRNTLYVGDKRPWQVLIPPGVAHGYKVISRETAVLVYVTSRFFDPADECRLPFDSPHLAYDWKTQFK
jgi:dTDP-4-dehydrorhamnose 3,5-epimerase